MNRKNLSKKCEKQNNNDSPALVLTHHPALTKGQEILKKAHRLTIRSCHITTTPSSCISKLKNTERSFSKIKAKDT